ncbi:hypothetical protein MJD09_17230, partial [bacterium]|nr:hypothetical protein [bacterium]
MSTTKFKIHFRIINLWLFYILFLIVFSNLPHVSFPVSSWINCSLYFVLFLQCVYLLKKTKHNKAIFFNLGLFSLVPSLQFINAFVGEGYLFGNDDLAWYFYEYSVIALSFLFALSLIYICIKYLFTNLTTPHLYVLCLAVILPIFVWHYHPFILNKDFIQTADENLLYQRDLYFNFLPLCFVVLYSILLYRYDRSLGEHINTLVVSLLMMNLMHVTNLIGWIYNINIFVFSQHVLFVVLCLFLITMFRLVSYTYSEFGQFYNELVIMGNHHGVPIKRRKSTLESILDFAKAYLQER